MQWRPYCTHQFELLLELKLLFNKGCSKVAFVKLLSHPFSKTAF